MNTKTLYYDKIDYSVVKESWDILEKKVQLPYVIHIVGTNAKGSTGRFIASFLHQQNKNVIHYSSPHIEKFNERIWINGENCSDNLLDHTHQKLQEILPYVLVEKLTYFEYTTLIALYLSSGSDFIVLEAGLGGEFDATNVVHNDLSVFTTISLDHQEFLGDSVEKIATTKMRSCDSAYILSPQIHPEVNRVKKSILKEKKEIQLHKYPLDKNGKNLPQYLQRNLQVALSVLSYLGFEDQYYTLPTLFGRFQRIKENITIDVGHNPLAALVIAQELECFGQKIILVYNSYKDKDYEKVIEILSPYIQEVQILELHDQRIVSKEQLEKYIKSLSINVQKFDILNMKNDQYYLVFGSFVVVENFLRDLRSL